MAGGALDGGGGPPDEAGALAAAAPLQGTAAPDAVGGLMEEQSGGGALAKMSATAAPMKPKKGADEGQNSAPRPMVSCCFRFCGRGTRLDGGAGASPPPAPISGGWVGTTLGKPQEFFWH